jgi:peroxiredoxin
MRFSSRLLIVIMLHFAFVPQLFAKGANFSLRSIEGRTVSSQSLKGKIVVLAFGATWLPLSKTLAREIQRTAENYTGRPVEVFWVGIDSASPKSKNYASDDQLRTFASRSGLKVEVLRDPDAQASKNLGVDQLPAFVIIDREGNISGVPMCGLDPNAEISDQISASIDKLLR